MTKCDIASVMTVVTGVKLTDDSDFHSVMDALYPGIMTIGCAMMADKAAEEIIRQHPLIRQFLELAPSVLPPDNKRRCDAFIREARCCFGEELEINAI